MLCALLSAAFVFSFAGCTDKSQNTATTNALATKLDTTTQTKASTADTASEQPTYNYTKLKQNSDSIKTNFDNLLVKKRFRGTVYVKIGTDFEYIGTNGFADKVSHTENSVNTTYRVGSVTKQFTAAAVMMLAEQGKLSIDDTLDKYYKDYQYGNKITIKNLLSMTSGIKDYINKDGYVDSSVYLPSQLDYTVTSKNSASKNKNAIMKWIFSQKLNFEPGKKSQFSNSSYYILGDIIEKVSKMSYESFVQSKILKPLDMTSSTFTKTKSLASGYQDVYDNEWTLYPGVAYSSSGLISNVPDLLKWVESLTNYELLSEKSVEQMFTAYMGDYGFGSFVYGNTVVQDGKIEKYNAKVSFAKDESTVFIALSNYTQSDPTNIINVLLNSIKPFYG